MLLFSFAMRGSASSSDRICGRLASQQVKPLGLSGNNQKVVLIAEVKQGIARGWEYATKLPTYKIILKLPRQSLFTNRTVT